MNLAMWALPGETTGPHVHFERAPKADRSIQCRTRHSSAWCFVVLDLEQVHPPARQFPPTVVTTVAALESSPRSIKSTTVIEPDPLAVLTVKWPRVG